MGPSTPRGSGVIIGSGYPEKQVSALFSPTLDPTPRPSYPSLPFALWAGSPNAVPRDPSSVPFTIQRGWAWGGGRDHLLGCWWRPREWAWASPPIFPAAKVSRPGARTLFCLHCLGATGYQEWTSEGASSELPQGIRGVLGPNGGPGGFGPRAVPRRDNANLRADLGVLGKPESATRPRPGSGSRGEGQATQVGLLSESPRVWPRHTVSGAHNTLARWSVLRMGSGK